MNNKEIKKWFAELRKLGLTPKEAYEYINGSIN